MGTCGHTGVCLCVCVYAYTYTNTGVFLCGLAALCFMNSVNGGEQGESRFVQSFPPERDQLIWTSDSHLALETGLCYTHAAEAFKLKLHQKQTSYSGKHFNLVAVWVQSHLQTHCGMWRHSTLCISSFFLMWALHSTAALKFLSRAAQCLIDRDKQLSVVNVFSFMNVKQVVALVSWAHTEDSPFENYPHIRSDSSNLKLKKGWW